MFKKIFQCLSVVLIASAWNPAPSHANEGCTLEGVKLDCSAGKRKPKWSAVTRAFASPETRKLLSDPHEHVTRFSKPIYREHFRKSVEKSWRAVNLYDAYSRRQLDRGKISDEEYLARVAQHREAEKTYEAAYWYYKNINWLQ